MQWLTFAPVSATAAEYFKVSETDINWLSTAFLFSFIAASPYVVPPSPQYTKLKLSGS